VAGVERASISMDLMVEYEMKPSVDGSTRGLVRVLFKKALNLARRRVAMEVLVARAQEDGDDAQPEKKPSIVGSVDHDWRTSPP